MIDPMLLILLLFSTIAFAGAPSNMHAPATGLSAAVADTLGANQHVFSFAPGRCSFEVRFNQQCHGGNVETTLSMLSLKDGDDNDMFTPAHSLPVSLDGEAWHVPGLGEDLVISFEGSAANYAYGDHSWATEGQNSNTAAFKCEPQGWSPAEELTCGLDEPVSRSDTISCTFLCSAPKPEDSHLQLSLATKRFTRHHRRSAPNPEALAKEFTSTITPTDDPINYAHGHCSFVLTIFEQCFMPSPDSLFSLQRIGLITNIFDNDGKVAAHYSNGAGRIDLGAVRLEGMGADGLRVRYNPDDDQVYFSFDLKWWATNTVDDGTKGGLCHWGNWGRDKLGCTEDEGPNEYRVSDITCVFIC